MPKRTDPEKVALIRDLWAKGLDKVTIALRVGVSVSTVERYAGEQSASRSVRKHEARKPLFDPKRDGCPEPVSLTAFLCGDPPPGRRELIASSKDTYRPTADDGTVPGPEAEPYRLTPRAATKPHLQ